MLHDIMQPLNIIRLSCGNIRAKMATGSNEHAQYVIDKMVRIEEQVIRASQLLQDLQDRYEITQEPGNQ